MHKQLDSLLNKQMSRKEFLATIGLGVASVVGLGSFLKLLTEKKHQSSGYGGSIYGGYSGKKTLR